MLALYRVPESPDREEVAPIPKNLHDEIWRITLNNFPCFPVDDDTNTEYLQQFVPVALAPENGRITRGTVSLEDHVHLPDTLLVVGSDSGHMDVDVVADRLGLLGVHRVFIPNSTQHSMWSFTAYSVFWWDRMMKGVHHAG